MSLTFQLIESLNLQIIMREVSLKSIDKAIEIIDNLNDDKLETITKNYANKQPTLLSYLMTATEDYQNDNLSGYIIYYFCLVMSAFENENIKLREVNLNEIEEIEDDFTNMLNDYFDTEDVEILESFSEQTSLVQFILIELSTEDDDGSTIDEETLTQMFIVFISMISILNKAIQDEN